MRTATVSRNHIAPPLSAKVAGLRYCKDSKPGIRRVRRGKSFRYIGPAGRRIADEDTLARIRKLAIPPAWTDVWIASDPNAHLQATGRDARGRKQYRYHPRWQEVRHQTKYDRLVPFARALPDLRRRVATDLREASLSKNKVLAAVVELLGKTFIRVGNSEYAKTNKSFGLTTLKDNHVKINGAELRFDFRGKSGVRQSLTFSDARLARIVKKCQDIPGQELFQYFDDEGRRRVVTSADVNAYLKDATGADFTAKDFRTWAGTLLAAVALRDEAPQSSTRKTKSTIVRAVERVAVHLGNTVSVCRTCYIHPYVMECYADGTLRDRLAATRRRVRGLTAEENAVLALLECRKDWRALLAQSVRAAA
jgi:DNA topoisomerase I